MRHVCVDPCLDGMQRYGCRETCQHNVVDNNLQSAAIYTGTAGTESDYYHFNIQQLANGSRLDRLCSVAPGLWHLQHMRANRTRHDVVVYAECRDAV
jgi:hypothetical protein